MIDEALNDEIKKGSKSNNHKIEANIIKKELYPNIDKLMKKYNKTFASIFKTLYETFKKNDLSIFENNLNNIIEK